MRDSSLSFGWVYMCTSVCVCVCVCMSVSERTPASHCSVCWYAEIVVEANDSLYRTRSGTQTKTHRVTDIFDNVRAVHCTQHYRSISLCESVCVCVIVRFLVCMHGLAFALVSMIHATCVPYLCS